MKKQIMTTRPVCDCGGYAVLGGKCGACYVPMKPEPSVAAKRVMREQAGESFPEYVRRLQREQN